MHYRNMTPNKAKIVEALHEKGITYWMLAQKMGCHEQTVCSHMRNPTDEYTAKVLKVIEGM